MNRRRSLAQLTPRRSALGRTGYERPYERRDHDHDDQYAVSLSKRQMDCAPDLLWNRAATFGGSGTNGRSRIDLARLTAMLRAKRLFVRPALVARIALARPRAVVNRRIARRLPVQSIANAVIAPRRCSGLRNGWRIHRGGEQQGHRWRNEGRKL